VAPQLSLRPSVQPTGCSQSCVCVCVCVRCPLLLHTSVPVLKYNTLLVLLKNVKTQLGLPTRLRESRLRGLFTPLRLKPKLPNPVYIYVKDNYTENPYRDTECVPLPGMGGLRHARPAPCKLFRLPPSACALPPAACLPPHRALRPAADSNAVPEPCVRGKDSMLHQAIGEATIWGNVCPLHGSGPVGGRMDFIECAQQNLTRQQPF
jgi:hypothetical protein